MIKDSTQVLHNDFGRKLVNEVQTYRPRTAIGMLSSLAMLEPAQIAAYDFQGLQIKDCVIATQIKAYIAVNFELRSKPWFYSAVSNLLTNAVFSQRTGLFCGSINSGATRCC